MEGVFYGDVPFCLLFHSILFTNVFIEIIPRDVFRFITFTYVKAVLGIRFIKAIFSVINFHPVTSYYVKVSKKWPHN